MEHSIHFCTMIRTEFGLQFRVKSLKTGLHKIY